MEKENESLNENVKQQPKETFEPLEMKVVDVKVEKGYATSSSDNPISINEWNNGSW